jgi:hypothetical protein
LGDRETITFASGILSFFLIFFISSFITYSGMLLSLSSTLISIVRLVFSLVIALSLLAMLSGDVLAQNQKKFKTSGKVLDSLTSKPLAFATIRIFDSATKKLVDGNVSSDGGDFQIDLSEGNYYAEIDFMGYTSFKSGKFHLSKERPGHDLGSIYLVASTNTLSEVVVQAEKSSMELSLDKKIFNIGKDLANAGGSANDILMNIPSVSVDPDGGVKLRGSSNVRILIDGKPSGLVSFKGGSGLQQLQASIIERVEIITNPSARYEAEGMAGIINIVLKKERKQGFNGSFEIITGHPVNYGAAANLNYRHKKVNFFINYAIAYRESPGVGTLYQEVENQGTTSILKHHRSEKRERHPAQL